MSYLTRMGQTKGTFKSLHYLGKSYVKQLIFQLLNDQTTQLKAQNDVNLI